MVASAGLQAMQGKIEDSIPNVGSFTGIMPIVDGCYKDDGNIETFEGLREVE